MGELKRKQLVVYTALFGDYDELEDPREISKECDFVCFTDQENVKTKAWRLKIIKNLDYPPPIMNRKYKMLPHIFLKEYEESIYIDANIIIKKNIMEFKGKYLNGWNIVVPRHFRRSCVYDEACEVIRLNLANKDLVLNQITTYKKDGLPINFGLTENNIIYRKHLKPEVIRLMEDWWEEFLKFPTRDQLSLIYVIWKNSSNLNKIKIKLIENMRGSEYFRLTLHKERKRESFIGNIINKLNEFRINNPNSKFSYFMDTIISISRRMSK